MTIAGMEGVTFKFTRQISVSGGSYGGSGSDGG